MNLLLIMITNSASLDLFSIIICNICPPVIFAHLLFIQKMCHCDLAFSLFCIGNKLSWSWLPDFQDVLFIYFP